MAAARCEWAATPVTNETEEEREFRRLKAECAAFNAVQQARHAALLANARLLLKQDRTDLRNAWRRHRRHQQTD